MEAGKLDRLVIIETATVGQDTHGGMIEYWTTLATVWAHVIPLNGTEKLLAAQITPQAMLIFRMYFRDDFDEHARIVYNGRVYNITNIDEIGYREGLNVTGRLVPNG